MKHVGRPVPNAALLGGFAAVTGRIMLASVVSAIRAEVSRARSPRRTSPRRRKRSSSRSKPKETIDA